jgi:hypothetical protein
MDPKEETADGSRFDRVMAKFAVPGHLETADSDLLDFVEDSQNPLRNEAQAFLANLKGVVSTIEMPHAMARRAVLQKEYFRIDMLVRVDSGLTTEEYTRPEVASRMRMQTTERFQGHLQDPSVQQKVLNETHQVLDSYLLAQETKEGAPELMRQATVLCWSSFEVLSRDVFVSFLNRHPKASRTLLADPTAKRKFDFSKVPLETLAEHDFDLSSRMGTILAGQQDLSDIVSIKSVYNALFTEPALRAALNADDLRLLSKRRNLIVHRCGIVDQRYLSETQDLQEENQRINIVAADLSRHLQSVRAAGFQLLRTASRE